jgi:hypothetical protein
MLNKTATDTDVPISAVQVKLMLQLLARDPRDAVGRFSNRGDRDQGHARIRAASGVQAARVKSLIFLKKTRNLSLHHRIEAV